MLEAIEKITKMSERQQRQTLLSYAKLPIKIKLELHGKHQIVFYKLKQSHIGISLSVLSYCALVIVAMLYKNNHKMLQSANFKNMNLEEILNLSLQKILIFKHLNSRRKKQYDLVLQYWSLVKTLKSQNISYRDISAYIQKYHRISISYSTIFKIYKKIEGNKNG